jgi:lipid-A-disaccharide synthase
MAPRIGIIVGEASGDILGEGLIKALRLVYPRASFEGVGGPRMKAQGFVSFYPMDRLSVMGFVDPLKRLPELLHMRANLVRHFKEERPDLFIGIDSPDFNLGIELKLRQAGIKTAHYVSPSVWAWRQGRVKKIARAVDMMLALFPFEAAFYRDHNVPVCCVGHPLADQYPLHSDALPTRAQLGLDAAGPLIAVMPGSRAGEIDLMGPVFIQAMAALLRELPDCRFVLPAANADRHAQLQALLRDHAAVSDALKARITLLEGQSREAMTAADLVVMTSGTTALEAMLLKKPMVVAYRVSPMTYRIMSRLIKVKYISLPNLLAGEALVPELIQDDLTAEALTAAVLGWLTDQGRRDQLLARFDQLHRDLRCDASRRAAEALLPLLPESAGPSAGCGAGRSESTESSPVEP